MTATEDSASVQPRPSVCRGDDGLDLAKALPTMGREPAANVLHLRANNVLRNKIARWLTRPVRRPLLTKVKRFFEDFHYQTASKEKERRVIAKIEWHPGELSTW